MMAEFDQAKLTDPVERGRFVGIARLLTQLEILEIRIADALTGCLPPNSKTDFLLYDVLHLDTETYYTVAFDALTLIERFLPEERTPEFRRETVYKVIRRLRNQFVRHARNKPNGDPYPEYGIGELEGIVLKDGTPKKGFRDPGFFKNSTALRELLTKYTLSPSRRYQDRAELRVWTMRVDPEQKTGAGTEGE
jgi:hypothetical protein